MKTNIKKIFKRTLIGSAMLIGILVSGGNTTSAATLKDSNGNPVVAGQEYYLSAHIRPNQGLAYTRSWGVYWAHLGTSPGEAITVEPSYTSTGQFAVMLKTNKVSSPIDINENTTALYLGTDTNNSTGEVYVRAQYPGDRSQWIPTTNNLNNDFISNHYFALKNVNNGKYLYARGFPFWEEDWLKAVDSEMNSNVVWRLLKK